MTQRKKIFWRFSLGIILLGLIGYFGFYQLYLPAKFQESGTNSQSIVFEIKNGEGLGTIATRLQDLGLIADEFVFLEFLKYENLDTQIQAGFFEFSGAETLAEVTQKLLHGSVKEIKFTIPEGLNSKQIDELLVQRGLIQSGEFVQVVQAGLADLPVMFQEREQQNLEGYLFPDTYFISPQNFDSKILVRKMLQTMQQKLDLIGFTAAATNFNLHEFLTLASIVELEELNPRNKPLIADILIRRLENGIALGADATLFYVLGHRKNLTKADLASTSPYNTRKFRGLPPTPVCAPGLASLQAVLKPQSNHFWYYLHGSDGEIHFGRNLEEHKANRQFL